MHENRRLAFTVWKEQTVSRRLQEQMSLRSQKFAADKRASFCEKIIKHHLRETFIIIRSQVVHIKVTKRLINALYRTRHGSMLKAFQTWKSLPSKKLFRKQSAANTIEARFQNLIQLRKKYVWDILKELWYQANEIKKQCIKKLLLVTGNKKQIYLRAWAENAKNLRHIEACKNTITLMKALESALKDNFVSVLGNTAQDTKKAEAIR